MVRNLQDYRWSRLIDWVCVAHEKNYCRKMQYDGLMYCSAKPDEEEKMDLNNGFTSFHLTPIHICGSVSLCTWCSSRIQKRTQLFLDKNKLAIAVQSYASVGPVGTNTLQLNTVVTQIQSCCVRRIWLFMIVAFYNQIC